MRTIALPPPADMRFAIFGQIHYLDYFIQGLHARGFAPPVVFVSPASQYDRDRRLLGPHGLWGDLDGLVARALAVKRVMEDVNTPECHDEIRRHRCNVGFSINCRNIIKRPLIDLFDGRIFNIHDSYLPNERGGALNTWRILNDIRRVGNTIHQVDEGIDSGDIAFQEMVDLEQEAPLPLDYDFAQVRCVHKIFDEFLDACVKNHTIRLRAQDHAASLYLPRLYTEVNGAIDWDWDVADVEKFIRGFADPYPGAYTFLKGKKLHVLRAEIGGAKRRFHPFVNGKVVNVLGDGSAAVVAGGGTLVVKRLRWEDGDLVDAASVLTTRHTLFTPPEILARARQHVPKITEMK